MAGFITARDGIYNVMQQITTGADGHFKVGYKHDRRFVTDEPGEGYPYYTVSPAFDANVVDQKGTVNDWLKYTIFVRLYEPYANDEASETKFLTLLDLALTTLRDDSNIRLNDTVSHSLVKSVRTGYNDDNQPTCRLAEIECVVTQLSPR